MADNILINTAELTLRASSAQHAANMLDTKLDTWAPQGERSIALDAFAQQFVALEQVMALYQELLLQDLEATKTVAREFLVSDSNLSKLWK